LRSLAVPVRDGEGHVIAAMNVSVQAGLISSETLVGDILPIMRTAIASLAPTLAV
jgi:IclR family pca regulon transcriptional regulator